MAFNDPSGPGEGTLSERDSRSLPDQEARRVTDLRAADTEEIARLDALKFYATCGECGGQMGDDATGGLSCRGCASRAEVVRLRAENEFLRRALMTVAFTPDGSSPDRLSKAETALASDEEGRSDG